MSASVPQPQISTRARQSTFHLPTSVSLTVVANLFAHWPSTALTYVQPLCDSSAGRRTPGQKVRLQSRPPFLPSMRLRSPGRLPGSSPPISTNQVTVNQPVNPLKTLLGCAFKTLSGTYVHHKTATPTPSPLVSSLQTFLFEIAFSVRFHFIQLFTFFF